jgi:hypothetical protein
MSRGDVTNDQWERLQPRLPPNSRRPVPRPRIIARSSTRSSGSCAPGRPGATCRSAVVPGAPWPVTSPIGSRRAGGSNCWPRCASRPMRRAGATGQSTMSMGPSSVPTGTRLGQNRGARDRSLKTQPMGFSTKVHLRADGHAPVLTVVVAPGQRHEAVVFPQRMAGGAVKHVGHDRLAPAAGCVSQLFLR